MNRIYLDKLFDFTYNTYTNYYGQYTKQIDLNDEILKFKQNSSLNEKGFFMKYSFVDLSNLITSIEYDECVLINPISFNIEENQEWFNFLNCLLLVLNDDYIKEANISKKKILQIADKMYKKHLLIGKKLNKENYEKISELTGLNIIIIQNENNILDVTEYKKTLIDKWLICYKFGNDYFPVWNFENKYFTANSHFLKYLHNTIDKISLNKKEVFDNENIKSDELNDKISENIEHVIEEEFKIDSKDENKIIVKGRTKTKDAYEEFVTNEDYALYISEAVDNKNTKKQKLKKNTDVVVDKKKNKANKNIFVVLEQDENKEEKLNDNCDKDNNNADSVFKKTEIIDIKKIKEILSNIKTSTKLEQIQSYAIELNIPIVSGSTKDGKPKNKTKNELIDEIKKLEKTL